MSKNAEKKATEQAAYWANILQIYLIVINVLYIVSLIWTLKSNDFSWTWSMLLWPAIYAWCEKQTYAMLVSELQRGLKPNYSLDIFGVVVASHTFSIYSDTLGTYILYIVPLYILYKVGGYALSYLKSKSDGARTPGSQDELSEAEAKKKNKKERQEKRAEKMGAAPGTRVKYSKH